MVFLLKWAQVSMARISSDIPLPHYPTFNITPTSTKSPPFHRWHFQMHFCPYFDLNFTEVCQYWFSNLIGCSTACSGLHQRKHQRYAIPSFREGNPLVTGSPHKGPVMQKVCSCHDAIMILTMLKWDHDSSLARAYWRNICGLKESSLKDLWWPWL